MGALLALLPIFTNILNKLIPDPQEKAQAQLAMQQALNQAAGQLEEAQAKELESMSKSWIADSQSSSWMTRNWKACFMFLFMALIFNQYFVNPILIAVGLHVIIPDLPSQAWDAVLTSLGVFGIGHSAEAVATTYSNAKFNKKLFYADLRKSIFKQGLTQDQADAIEAALNDAEQSN